jgi:uncharacterized cupredoxin-like copper-binding protein
MKLPSAQTALLLVAVMALAACGGDDDGGGEAADATQLSIDATDQGIEAPQSIEAGLVEITFTNSGKRPHEAQLIRLEGGHTPEQALKVVTGDSQRIPDWIVGGGGVGTTKPGATGTATQILDPGSYAIVDTQTDKPASATLEVTGQAAEADLPDADATVTAREYTFEASGLKAGKNTILFENTGKQLHHLIANPVKQDATPEQIIKFFESEEKSANPFRGGEEAGVATSVIDTGTSQVIELDLKAGNYAFQCFIPDRAGGPPHALKGMITIEKVQ